MLGYWPPRLCAGRAKLPYSHCPNKLSLPFPPARPDSLPCVGPARLPTASLRKKWRGPQARGSASSTVFKSRVSGWMSWVINSVSTSSPAVLLPVGALACAMSGEAALPGVSSICHICIYLKLSWWSSVSGMPLVGLAYYYLGLD